MGALAIERPETAQAPPALAPPMTRLQRRKARTRRAILEAASTLFDQQGYDQTSIQHVAELADTGVGTLYGYFRSKEDLLHEVLRERSAQAVEGYMTSLRSGTTAADRVLAALDVFTKFIDANRPILLATFQVATRRGDELDEPPAQWLFMAFRQMMDAGIAAGELRPVPVDATARSLIGLHLMAVLGIGIFRDRANDPTLVADLRTIARALLER